MDTHTHTVLITTLKVSNISTMALHRTLVGDGREAKNVFDYSGLPVKQLDGTISYKWTQLSSEGICRKLAGKSV